jgi:putative ABC transport system permease protein
MDTHVDGGRRTCVLLIACADAAGLLAVRAEERKREVAIRQAVGASRGRIVRQLLFESLLVSALGAMVGLVFAVWLSGILVALAPPGFVLPTETASPVIGTRVLFFTMSAAMLTAILVGPAPAVGGSKVDLTPMLKNQARFVSGVAGRFRLRYAFVVLQVALSAVLLVGAGLLLRTLWNAHRVDLGFETAHLLVGSVDVGKQGYDETERRSVFARLIDEVRAMPGVRAAGLARTVPVQRSVMRMAATIDGIDLPPNEETDLNVVGPDFFAALGVQVRGRDFDASDTEQSSAVAIVNQAFADRYWPGGDAIGKHLNGIVSGKSAEIIGVVANFKLRSLREGPTPVMYAAAAQFYLSRMTIAVRSESDPAAAMGFYALFCYLTRLRTREFAIRVALGAGRADLVGLVVGKSATFAALGIVVGLGAAFLLSQALADLLLGVAPLDPTSFVASALLLLAAPIVASYIPARRAAHVDPAGALRHE